MIRISCEAVKREEAALVDGRSRVGRCRRPTGVQQDQHRVHAGASRDNGDVVAHVSPAAVSGYPNVTVPAGDVGPLPVGMSFISTAWADGDVLSLADAFERATHVRVPPQLLATIGS